jgi:hypothetical protein
MAEAATSLTLMIPPIWQTKSKRLRCFLPLIETEWGKVGGNTLKITYRWTAWSMNMSVYLMKC